MQDFFVNAFEEVMRPYMNVQSEKWANNDKRLDHMERIMNAHTIQLHNIDSKLNAFIDRSVQHTERFDNHEMRIVKLELA